MVSFGFWRLNVMNYFGLNLEEVSQNTFWNFIKGSPNILIKWTNLIISALNECSLSIILYR